MQYAPKLFFLQVANDLLREFFDARGELRDFPWVALAPDDADSLYDAWLKLPDASRADAESQFRAVFGLAYAEGVVGLIDEGRFQGVDLTTVLEARDGSVEKVFYVFLRHRRVFDVASRFDHADRLNRRYWQIRKDIPRKKPDVARPTRAKLADALSALYREQQGRGEKCQIECYLRGGTHHYFFAYPADFATTFAEWSGESLERKAHKPAFEIVFIYNEQEGTLSLHVTGTKELKAALQRIFAEVILGVELGPESAAAAPFVLGPLKHRDFRFQTEPTDAIREIRVRSLRLDVLGSGDRITIQPPARRRDRSVYDAMDSNLDSRQLPLSNVDVSFAELQFVFDLGDGKTKTVSCNLSGKNSCNLRDTAEHLKAKEILKRSGILRV